MEITFEEAAQGPKRKSPSTKPEVRVCQGTGAEKGATTKNLSDVRRARPGDQFARNFQHRANMSALQGRGRVIENLCKLPRARGAGKRLRRSRCKIPAGVDTGSRLRSSGNGEAGLRGGPPAIFM